jgi:radical SAM-linked protein
MFLFEFNFCKKGDIKFISHLDLMRLFARALRRSGLPIKITEGFNPHPKFSIQKALKLGVESDSEQAQIALVDSVPAPEFYSKLQPQLPEGIVIKSIWQKKF